MPLRTIEHGFDKHTLDYSTPEKCEAKAKELADRLQGMCNVRIVPNIPPLPGALPDKPGTTRLRYTAIFSCFEHEQDMFRLVHMFTNGKCFIIHR